MGGCVLLQLRNDRVRIKKRDLFMRGKSESLGHASSDSRGSASCHGLARCPTVTKRPHQLNKRWDARRAPSRRLVSLAHTTSSATRPQPAEVSKPQSVPARTRVGSPTTAAI